MRTTNSHNWLPVYQQCLDTPDEWVLAHEYCKKSHVAYARRKLLETMKEPRNDGTGYSRLYVRLSSSNINEFLRQHTYLHKRINASNYIIDDSHVSDEAWKAIFNRGIV